MTSPLATGGASTVEGHCYTGSPTGYHRGAEGQGLEDSRRGEDILGNAASEEHWRTPPPPRIYQPSMYTPTRGDHFPAFHAPIPLSMAGARNNEVDPAADTWNVSAHAVEVAQARLQAVGICRKTYMLDWHYR
ncbi:hypothetical protein FIBSPDRAFT_897290 [Athelia psychrophila]|uniref:Uncharacterized protein n=1 Tax=Athelia psychrophila TaxID=1759441 RepID=A0A166CGR0_9AGAM|nr:hypothetical protein FIBSPDRAFT_897290 [Fibularhizoctonia sp. CBS 109695]